MIAQTVTHQADYETASRHIPQIKRVIFDNDSLLIASESLAMRVMDTMGVQLVENARPGTTVDADYIYNGFSGRQTSQIVEELIEEFGLPVADIIQQYGLKDTDSSDIKKVAEQVAEQITEKTLEAFQSGDLKTVPHILTALDEIEKLVGKENMGLCTTSPKNRMNISLESTIHRETGQPAGLDQRFPSGDQRVSGYDVINKYEKYLKLNPEVDPRTTAVFEDSDSSAKKAADLGFQVVGSVADKEFYPGEKGQEQIQKLLTAGVKIVVSDTRDFSQAIEWMNTGFDPKQKPEFHDRVELNPKNMPTTTPAGHPAQGAPKNENNYG